MRPPVVITTPMPTPEETAKLLGIPKKDVKRLEALVDSWAWNPDTIREFGEPLRRPDLTTLRGKPSNGGAKRHKATGQARKRSTRENGHR